jgi:hypothetical protein
MEGRHFMAARTVQLPEPVFIELNALKIRIVKSTDKIPTNGNIIRAALALAANHYDELVTKLSDSEDSE